MAEAMTVETIIEADWQMRGYWTKLRVPLQTPKGSWSDIDVVAYHPERRHLVLCESKVRGPKKAVYAYTKYTQQEYGSILDFDERDEGVHNYFAFLRHIRSACRDGVLFEHFTKMVKKLTVQLVSNYYVTPDVAEKAMLSVEKKIGRAVPAGVVLNVRLDTTLDVIARIITEENHKEQGRRYGHPVIDLARELNRYMHPIIHYAGREKAATDLVRSKLHETLRKAIWPLEAGGAGDGH